MQGDIAYYIENIKTGEVWSGIFASHGVKKTIWYAWKDEAEHKIEVMVALGIWKEGEQVVKSHRSDY